jgi:hypothetical protein
MTDESSVDLFLDRLCAGYSEAEVSEIKQYIKDWDASTYTSVAHSILDHALRKEFEPLKYLRKANNFNKKGAIRVPKIGFRQDASAVYRKGYEYLIVRIDSFGVEKIVSYGINDE